ncbi:MAG: lysophospholipid acyltransferase family protein [Tannerella sp.]|jgi:KDO2-lipid IV(A) lauroyltransferase|nr:lysophospholipid acyltransferase family protein [Tannerella sp.]
MGNNVLYVILFLWVKIHALLPMPVLFVLSDVFYFFIYYMARYRRGVVRNNLRNSFPGMAEKEIRKLERRFYRHFADYIIETIKLAHISQEELLRRANIRNPELIYGLLDKGHSCLILTMGHYGNWEWFSGASARFEGRATVYPVYRPIQNKAFDRLFIYLRTRFHSCGIKKNNTIRDLVRLKQNKTPALLPFLADQTPSKANLHYWTTFLNQESAILTGPERIAKKLDIPVIFADIIKVKRGYYTADLKLITEKAKDTGKFLITEEYARMMEKTILRDPAYWLWTHKRWKHNAGS